MTTNTDNQLLSNTSQQPLVSVVYVNYRTFHLLQHSIQSLEEHCTVIPFEIIIVDNASGGNERNMLEEWLRRKALKNARLIFSESNLGFAAANNLGAAHAASPYLFFLNPDTLILNDVIALFYKYLEQSDRQVAACGASLLKPDHSPNSSYGNFPGLLLELCNVGLGLSFLLNGYYQKHVAIGCTMTSGKILEVPYIVGADIFIRSEAFTAAGRFDENFFMYYEETDLFSRLKKLNYTSCILPEARIVHLEGGAVGRSSKKDFNYLKFEMILRSKLYYYKKWHGRTLLVIKGLIKMQILVQYLKGKWGNDLRRLYGIYDKVSH
ncbi:MAG: glycosyltransferase family 2 protein [Daejeonella sp.]